jgi:hypothetical protein
MKKAPTGHNVKIVALRNEENLDNIAIASYNHFPIKVDSDVRDC